MSVMTDADLYARLRGVLKREWVTIPDYPGYGGTGAPGKMLEELLGLDGGNLDTPDAGRWEIKFHSGSAPLTLFHLEAEPRGHMHTMVRTFGWRDSKGRSSFRHTIWGQSDMGFNVANESNRITVRHPNEADIAWPYWTHDRLMNAFAAKLRRLIALKGRRKTIGGIKHVRYDTAHLYWEPRTSQFVKAIEKGIVAIDFDARTSNGRGLRNHGTKFRVQADKLRAIYQYQQKFTA